MTRPLRFRLALAMLLAACGDPAPHAAPAADDAAAAAEVLVAPGPHDVAVLDMGALGEIRIELLPEIAPRTVERFVEVARRGGYDGTTFHRVVPGYVIQGGNPWTLDADPRNDDNGNGGPGVPDEFGLYPHVRGTVSFANAGLPDSGKLQFFIVHEDHRELDGHYAAFGRVVAGIDVVDAITRLEIDQYGRFGPPDRPHPVDARIVSVRIEPAAPAQTSGARLDPPGASG